jgi:Ni/Fe-hydrogenase 1 B-type cytochrome subunit
MAITTTTHAPPAKPATRYERVYVWEWGVRLFHWGSAASLTVLFLTGLYIADPILTTSGEPFDVFLMARVREVHFVAAYAFLLLFLWRIYLFWFGNKYARTGLPRPWKKRWWSDVVRQASDYAKLDAGRPHLGHNALAGLSYVLFVVALGWGQILTGFALFSESNPGGFWDGAVGWVIPLLGGSFRTHMWHNLFGWGFLVFAILHVYIVFFDSRQYRNGLISSMITGFKFKPVSKDEHVP